MRNRLLFAFVPGAMVALAWACGSNPSNPVVALDSGVAETGAGGDDTGAARRPRRGPLPDAAMGSCKLSDGSDPVALCVQEQQVIGFELQYAYTNGKGVAPGWASSAPYAALTGHDWHDDLGLAGTLGAFYCSAEIYGNNLSSAAVTAVLTDLGGVLVPELQQALLTGYDGEVYFRLRWAQAAFNYANDATAAKLQSMADAYGAGIAAQAYPVAAAAGDGGDGGSPGGTVIGTKNADGSVTYAPAQTVMAAAALLDMAVIGATGPDAGPVKAWASTAQQVITYVLARGRDPVTGLFYQSLTTSGDPGHDAVGVGAPTNDSMLTDTQAWAILGLSRAQDLLVTYEMSPAADAGADAASEAGHPHRDRTGSPGATSRPPRPPQACSTASTTSAAPAVQPVGAVMEGLVLSGSQVLTNKTTIGNAVMLGGFHRVTVGQGTVLSYELGEIRSALGWVPAGTLQPAHTSLLTIVTDANGDLLQQTYLRAGSKAFGFADAYSPGSEPVAQGQEPGATNYRSDAVHAMVEGFTQLWYGAANDARCAP